MAIRPMSVDEYHRLTQTSVLDKDDRVELLEGWIVSKKPLKPEIATARSLTSQALEAVLADSFYLQIGGAITTSDSEPEPDISILRGSPRDYANRHPGANDTILVVEISGGTLAADRQLKKRVYARAGIGVYWIVNVPQSKVEVYTDASGPSEAPDYDRQKDFGINQSIPLMFDGRIIERIAVRDLLP